MGRASLPPADRAVAADGRTSDPTATIASPANHRWHPIYIIEFAASK
ncbi:MAG: hypothetical protein AAF670_09810 [Planctomycetota bacterium]